jgi:two-component system LytT family sensor kinase
VGDSYNKSSSAFQRLPVFWKSQLIGWGILIPYTFLLRLTIWKDPMLAFELTIALEPLAFILSLGLRFIYRKIGLRRSEIGRTIVVASLASLVAAGIELAWSEWILSLRGSEPESRVVRLVFYWMVFQGWSFVFFWLKGVLQIRSERMRLHELESAAERAELAMLRLQLNPHFLFSSLNNIAEEIPDDPAVAIGMTRDLGKFLRYTLEAHDEGFVALSDEIGALKCYLSIEENRFRNRLQTQIIVESDTGNVLLPRLLLQPLVENAVKHGVMSCSPPWRLSMEITREGGSLRIRVSNIGTLLKDWQNRKGANGISNLRKRLALHYPDRHHFQLYQDRDQVVADLELKDVAADGTR